MTRGIVTTLVVAVAVLLTAASSHAGANYCGGYSSAGNPFACCDNNGDGTMDSSIDGNCTWWAWREAKNDWGKTPPVTGGPSSWISQAKAKGFKTSSTPAKKTIGVKSNHVVWVKDVQARMEWNKKKKKWVDSGQKDIIVSEMNCGPGKKWASGKKDNITYPAENFKFIYKK